MRILFAAAIAGAGLAVAPVVAAPSANGSAIVRVAAATAPQDWRDRDRDRQGWRDRQDNREWRRDWRRYRNYDYNRLPPGERSYNPADYYRDGRYYRERRLTRNDRIYRGNDGRYYCRRSDGTTGLIVGGVAGGLLGNALSDGRNATLGTLLGAAAGAALGSSVDRGQVRCR